MSSFRKRRRSSGITNAVFGAVVAVLVIVAALGYGLYGTAASKTVTSTNTVTTMNVSTEMVTTEMSHSSSSMNNENTTSPSAAYMFTAKSGAMVSQAWLLVLPTGMMHDEYAISIHAEGLESNGTYIVEGALSSGGMNVVPISSQSMNMNMTGGSEFQAEENGTGNYWVVLDSNPATTFENVQILFLPGMDMQNAMPVASVNLSMMMTTSETTMMATTTQ